jgi:malonyl-CoA O-methyltransferase
MPEELKAGSIRDDAAYRKDRRRIVRAFNRAAPGYEQVAAFQREVAARLLERLEIMRVRPRRILDLGCGTGRTAAQLGRRFRRAEIIALDLAEEMLRRCRPSWWRRPFSRRRIVCADAASLPLAPASVDLVYSNLMLQWSDEPAAVFKAVRGILRPGGLFLFSTLGPDTLQELRESWAHVDDFVHVNAFADMHDIGDALVGAGFADPVMEAERFTLAYENAFALMKDLRELGAGNANQGRRRTLTGGRRMQRMIEHYENRRISGRLPATYEVVFGHGWAGDMALRVDAQTATFPLAALRGRRRGTGGG